MNYSEKLFRICKILFKHEHLAKQNDFVEEYTKTIFNEELSGRDPDGDKRYLNYVDIAKEILKVK